MYSKTEDYKKLFLTELKKSDFQWVNQVKKAAITNAFNVGQPSQKDEEWRYTKYSPNNFDNLLPYANDQNSVGDVTISNDHYNIFIVNGDLQNSNERLPKGLKICKLSDLLKINNEEISKIKSLFTNDSIFNKIFNTSLNNAFCDDPIIVQIDSNVIVDKPIHLFYLGNEAIKTVYSQCIFIISNNAKTSIIEHFTDNSIANYNHVSRFIIGKNAIVNNYYIQNLSKNSTKHYTSDIQLENSASYNDFSICIGGSVARKEVHANIKNKSVCDLNSVVIGNKNQHHDTYFNFYHSAKESYSNQTVKQILDDKSKAVFYGKVYIPDNCPNSEAHQLNKNILLSDFSQVFSRPELQIYTDEVKCTHGSTTGNIDEEMLYYLRTRGFDESLAIDLLLEGFYLEMLDKIQDEEVKKLMKSELRRTKISNKYYGSTNIE